MPSREVGRLIPLNSSFIDGANKRSLRDSADTLPDGSDRGCLTKRFSDESVSSDRLVAIRFIRVLLQQL